MTMDATPRWALPQLFAGQAQKELFHNEALTLVDALLHGQVESADEAAPPASPAIGACWIVAPGGTGAWSGRTGSVACWTEGGWRFITPRAGLALWVSDRGHRLCHDGADWHDAALREDGLYMAGHRVVGERMAAIAGPVGGAVIDGEARAAIVQILNALANHGLIGP